jgi:hypothetical protein
MTPQRLDKIAEWAIIVWMLAFVAYFAWELSR